MELIYVFHKSIMILPTTPPPFLIPVIFRVVKGQFEELWVPGVSQPRTVMNLLKTLDQAYGISRLQPKDEILSILSSL